MSWQWLILVVVSHLAAVVAVFGLLYGLPSLARSAYRYRLWNLRDELWDAVYRGHLQGVEEGASLLQAVEQRIRSVHQWSAVRFLSATYAIYRHVPYLLDDINKKLLDATTREYTNPLVAEYAARADDLSGRYMRFATAFGWFPRPMMALVARFGARITPESRDEVEAAGDSIDREFRNLARLYAGHPRPHDTPLSGLT